VTAGILFGWLLLLIAGFARSSVAGVLAGAVMLAAVSWLDDRRGLPALPRLAVHAVAVAIGLFVALPPGLVFRGYLPPLLDKAAAGLCWLWFVNLFNFMDGIDGIDGGEAAAVGIGLMAFASVGSDKDPVLAAMAACIVTAALGFLVWNWAPARIFLGDVGSIPLGYLLGFLLLSVAARGHWKLALILPLYFLADATITLLRRLARGERVWTPHREHFYQRATLRGLGHAAVVYRVLAVDAVLIACGWLAENGAGAAMLVVAGIAVAALLAELAGIGRRRPA